jgi:hypothetical protein
MTPEETKATIAGFSSGSDLPTASTADRLATQLKAQWKGDWTIKGIDRAKELAGLLADQGITDLSKLSVKHSDREDKPGGYETSRGDPVNGIASTFVSDPNYTVKSRVANLSIGDKQLGRLKVIGSKGNLEEDKNQQDYLDQLAPDVYRLGSSFAGKGHVQFALVRDKNTNKPVIMPAWESSSAGDRGDAIMAASILAAPFTAGASTAIGEGIGLSGLAASAAGSAVIGGGTAALTGGNIAKGALLGGIGGAMPAIPGFAGLSAGAQAALKGALINGLASKGNPKSTLLGGITGGIGGTTNPMIGNLIKSLLQSSMVANRVPKKP